MIRSKVHPAREGAIVLGAILLFSWLARMASQAEAPRFDMAVRELVHAHAHPWVTWLMQAASLVGSGLVLLPCGAFLVGLLARAGRGVDATLFAIAVVGANLIDEIMKVIFHRVRPAPWFDYPLPSTYSFPSGHAFVSFCFFLCLAEILICEEWPPARKSAIWGVALGCTLTIGLSRVYLGVHYPTDVLAGYVAATVWTTVIRVLHHVWQEKRTAKGVESTPLSEAGR